MQPNPIYTSHKRWSSVRPKALVIACSDGRIQESLDEFLEHHLGILAYDRLYTPGGPGALAAGGFELLRADQFRREFAFLMKAHGTEEVILLFHGATEDGPDAGICADYKRLLPRASRQEIARRQEQDAAEVLRHAFVGLSPARVHILRAEVDQDGTVHFVDLRDRI